ncbi:hypothetical protein B0919_24235 [Hymenobacter sp. CRA2]|nr:hypothetical protein B0919_24235 [Hymenobacter sp. CRA2]
MREPEVELDERLPLLRVRVPLSELLALPLPRMVPLVVEPVPIEPLVVIEPEVVPLPLVVPEVLMPLVVPEVVPDVVPVVEPEVL